MVGELWRKDRLTRSNGRGNGTKCGIGGLISTCGGTAYPIGTSIRCRGGVHTPLPTSTVARQTRARAHLYTLLLFRFACTSAVCSRTVIPGFESKMATDEYDDTGLDPSEYHSTSTRKHVQHTAQLCIARTTCHYVIDIHSLIHHYLIHRDIDIKTPRTAAVRTEQI